jgi:hypothetical protein
MLRVLYLWNTAGALTPVADWLVANGHQARILMSSKYDLFGNTSMSKTAQMVNSNMEYYNAVVTQLLAYRPTHIHVNQHLQSLVLARLLCPSTPIVFQYHGAEVRYRKTVHPEMALADKVIVSTPDLKRYGEWYDRPVHSMFNYRGGRKKNTAVMFYASFYMKDLRKEARDWCRKRGIELEILEREKGQGVEYMQMPEFLSRFEYFLDFKGYEHPDAISRLAVEALACGCKVVSDTNPDRVIETYKFARPEMYFRLYQSISPPSPSFKRELVVLAGIAKWATRRLAVLPRNPHKNVRYV